MWEFRLSGCFHLVGEIPKFITFVYLSSHPGTQLPSEIPGAIKLLITPKTVIPRNAIFNYFASYLIAHCFIVAS